jgi:GTP-binding protein
MTIEPLAIKTAEFIKSAVRPRHYPPEQFPEVAFAGRSNVGKSSLINCLVQRKKLVRVSQTPGLTQTINFFLINGLFYLVDLPGYGYAKVPMSVRAQWGVMVESYLTTRQSLRGMVQIMDIRRPPTPDDLQLWQWTREQAIPAIPVLTKADKISSAKQTSQVALAAASLSVDPSDIVVFSSTTRLGRQELLVRLLQWISTPLQTE